MKGNVYRVDGGERECLDVVVPHGPPAWRTRTLALLEMNAINIFLQFRGDLSVLISFFLLDIAPFVQRYMPLY